MPIAWASRSIFRVETPLMKASWTTAISACSDRCPLRDEERHIAALADLGHEQIDRAHPGIHSPGPAPEKCVVRSFECFPLAAPTLASASILIISVITHLSMARKGSGSVMNCNSAFLKGVL